MVFGFFRLTSLYSRFTSLAKPVSLLTAMQDTSTVCSSTASASACTKSG